MGEYANYRGDEIKIGTCESMYYLRYEDRHLVEWIRGNVDASRDTGLLWRLPFPDEDGRGPGNYEDYGRGIQLRRGDEWLRCPELAAEHGLTDHLSTLFRWKPEINMAIWKAADESITKPLAAAITAKPGRPSFTIDIIKE